VTISDFKLYYRAKAIKTVWYCMKTYENQWNRIKDTDLNLHSCAHMIFDKGVKNMMEKRLFNKCCWESCIKSLHSEN
jgi:hypothetical protein